MRTYRVTIDPAAAYEGGNSDVWDGGCSLRKRNPAGLSPLFRELDRECLVSCFQPMWDRGSAAFDVIVFGKPFLDNTEYVKQMVVRARDIWDLGLAEDLAPHLNVQEITALELFDGERSAEGVSREMLLQANLFELRCALRSNYMRGTPMHDYICTLNIPQQHALELAAEGRYSRSLVRELDNVYRGSQATDDLCGSNVDARRRIPVHYLLEGAGTPHYESAVDLAVNALDTMGRLPSRHVYHLRFAENEGVDTRDLDFESLMNERLACALEGNVLVVEYGVSDSDGRFNSGLYQRFSHTLLLLNDHLDAIQLFILVPPGNDELKQRVRDKLRVPLANIDLDRDAAGWSHAGAYDELCAMAREAQVEVDDCLTSLLTRHEAQKTHYSARQIFDEWLALKQTTSAFPQYRADYERFGRSGMSADDAYRRLDGLVGLEEPKRLIREVVQRLKMNERLMKAGLPARTFSMHMAFMGSPGTGKTEVARLYGEILRSEGVLSEGRLIIESGPDMKILPNWERYVGSVLFIDEAYGMRCDVSSLIAFMENHRSDTVVILAGYPGRMKSLLSSNQGFRSRIGFTVNFPDYTVEQMKDIFGVMATAHDVLLEEGCDSVVLDVLARGGRRSDQGNARFVRNLFENAMGAQQVRLAARVDADPTWNPPREDIQTLTTQDIARAGERLCAPASPRKNEDEGLSARQKLDRLIGLENVKKAIAHYLSYARVRKLRRDRGLTAGFIPMHMALLGNPGTGKTEVARLVAQILREEGVLSVGELFECSRANLVQPPLTTDLVNTLFNEARGSVIFIDEAYSLAHPGGTEAITAIVDNMEKLRDEVVVIFAGYTQEVADMISLNPGLDSRIKTKVSFPDYSIDELWEILLLMARTRGFYIDGDVKPVFMEDIAKAAQRKGFGNARTVRTMLEESTIAQSARIAHETDDLAHVPDDDRYLMTLTAADFTGRMRSDEDAGKRTIGFGC